MVAIKTSGGIAQQFAGKHLDIRKTLKIESADTPEEAVKKVLKLVDESRKKRNILTELDKDMLHLTDKKDWEKVIKQINKNKKIIF